MYQPASCGSSGSTSANSRAPLDAPLPVVIHSSRPHSRVSALNRTCPPNSAAGCGVESLVVWMISVKRESGSGGSASASSRRHSSPSTHAAAPRPRRARTPASAKSPPRLTPLHSCTFPPCLVGSDLLNQFNTGKGRAGMTTPLRVERDHSRNLPDPALVRPLKRLPFGDGRSTGIARVGPAGLGNLDDDVMLRARQIDRVDDRGSAAEQLDRLRRRRQFLGR